MKVCDSWIRTQRRADAHHSALSLICATTALAAHNFTGGTTAHSLFKIPADDADQQEEDYVVESRLPYFPGAKRLVDAAEFIGWDEFPCTHRIVFEAAYRATTGFAGKILMCSGDLRQLTPVVQSSSVAHQVDASPVHSHYWEKFEVFVLDENMRQAADPDYAQFITDIGEAKDGADYEHSSAVVDISSFVTRAFSPARVEDAIRFAYPHSNDQSLEPVDRAKQMSRMAILAHTNERVAFWNQEVQNTLRLGRCRTYFSRNRLRDIHDHDERAQLRTVECLQHCDAADVPTHELKLHVGDLCILMRNIDKPVGLTNNQRVIIQALSDHTVGVSIARDDAHPVHVHWLPRIHFRFVMPGTSFDMVRTQFPLKLAYAFTVHKAQGQELERVLLDATTPVFAHGQLYVALSRVRTRNDIGAFVDDIDHADGKILCKNIVFQNLIASLFNTVQRQT